MKVAVWDTYVTKRDGQIMHFDILVEDHVGESVVYQVGANYLVSKEQQDQPITANECKLCHIEAASSEIQERINSDGYYIIEMEGCD